MKKRYSMVSTLFGEDAGNCRARLFKGSIKR